VAETGELLPDAVAAVTRVVSEDDAGVSAQGDGVAPPGELEAPADETGGDPA